MRKNLLLLRLEGPLQSWGIRARWVHRDSQPEPTKSGIIGLLGCALGITRYHPKLEELDSKLMIGVRVEKQGTYLRDYHTVLGPLLKAEGKLKDTTILSDREYLEDSSFLVALEARDSDGEELLMECSQAVQNPKWPYFLGRKCCIPSRPVFECFTNKYENIEDALSRYPMGISEVERKPVDDYFAWIEDPDGSYRRQDSIRINRARLYGFRQVKLVNMQAIEKTKGASS